MVEQPGYVELIESARHPDAAVTLALAGAIALAPSRAAPYDRCLFGLDAQALARLVERHFPDLAVPLQSGGDATPRTARIDEFDDLLALLLQSRTVADEDSCWLAYAIATASMGGNHLWQDLGLPGRATLSWLLNTYFEPLASRNTGNMRWKKFFYRMLCEQADVALCSSPSCSECSDYDACFGPEERVASALPAPPGRTSAAPEARVPRTV